MDRLDAQIPRIVLSHNLDSAEKLQQWRVYLQLSGHTHGGQVVLPGRGCVPTWRVTQECQFITKLYIASYFVRISAIPPLG